MRRIGVFGGSFDPIHLGHIMVAITLKEAHKLDHILFVPAKENPLKKKRPHASEKERLKMLKMALKGVPDCSVLTSELEREGPSYMIDTIRELQKKRKGVKFFLLLGEDLLSELTSWKEVHELLKIAPPLVAQRCSSSLHGPWEKDPFLKKVVLQGKTQTPLFDVCATEIRKRFKKKMFCGHLVYKAVLRYIENNRIYTE